MPAQLGKSRKKRTAEFDEKCIKKIPSVSPDAFCLHALDLLADLVHRVPKPLDDCASLSGDAFCCGTLGMVVRIHFARNGFPTAIPLGATNNSK